MSVQRPEWTGKDTAQCVGMLLLSGGALLAVTGHLSVDHMRVYAHTAGEYAPTAGLGVVGVGLGVAMILVGLRYLRAAITTTARNVWLYRRHWAAVMDTLGLAVTTEGALRVPRLRTVVRIGTEDVLSVRMVKGQTAWKFHEQSAALAAEFGATSARIRPGQLAHRDVEIVLSRGGTGRPMLALPAPQPQHPVLTMPEKKQQQAIRLTGLRLQIVWAHVQRRDQNGVKVRIPLRERFGLAGDVRWCTTCAVI